MKIKALRVLMEDGGRSQLLLLWLKTDENQSTESTDGKMKVGFMMPTWQSLFAPWHQALAVVTENRWKSKKWEYWWEDGGRSQLLLLWLKTDKNQRNESIDGKMEVDPSYCCCDWKQMKIKALRVLMGRWR